MNIEELEDFKQKCLQFQRTLNPNKIYIISENLDVSTICNKINHPYATITQRMAYLNDQAKINHTALIYQIWQKPKSDGTVSALATVVDSNTGVGVKKHTLFQYMLNFKKAGGGMLYFHPLPKGNKELTKKQIEDIEAFVDSKLLGLGYNFWRAIGSQVYKKVWLQPLAWVSKILGKIGLKNVNEYFCSHLGVEVIIKFLEPAQLPKKLADKIIKGILQGDFTPAALYFILTEEEEPISFEVK